MILEDIKKAEEVLENRVDEHYANNFFARIYAFSNENSTYLKNNNYQNKIVLTTGSSSDQVFNLINYGCNNISLFDINPFIKYYYELKRAAIIGLNKEEFLKYFDGYCNIFNENSILSIFTFNKIKEYMDDDAQKFWQNLYDKYETEIIYRNLFFPNLLSKQNIILNNPYLNNFNYLRKRFDQVSVSFKITNLINLKKELYDYIILSNIFDYIFNLIVKNKYEIIESLHEYKSLLLKTSELLKENGTMFFHYFWNLYDNDVYYIINKFLRNNNIETIEFDSCNHQRNNRDGMLVYIKK